MAQNIQWVAVLAVAVAACGGKAESEGATSAQPLAVDPAALRIPFSDPLCLAFDAWPKDAPFRSDMLLWLRADDGVTLAPDGTVARWADQSGHADRDATPPFPGMLGPSYVPHAYGSLPALRGDGTESLLVNSGHGYPVGKQSSLFLVASPSSSSPSSGGLTYYNESTQGWQYAIRQDTGGVHWLNAPTAGIEVADSGAVVGLSGSEDTFLFTPPPSPGLHVYAETQRDGLVAQGYFDGPLVASLAAPQGPSLYLMSLFGGPGNAFDEHLPDGGGFDPEGVVISAGTFDTTGDIVEVIQYDRALGAAEVALVEAYLWTKWFADPTLCPAPTP